MEFIRLNRKKALFKLLINLSICSVVVLILFGIMYKRSTSLDDFPFLLIAVYSFGLCFYLIYFFAGWHAFHVSYMLFEKIKALNIFDDNLFLIGYLEKKALIFYTKKCLCGIVDGYPVIISFNLATGKGETSKLDFEFITIKFKHTYSELMFIELNWLRGYEPKKDIKREVTSFVEHLKLKSSVKGNFESIIGEERISVDEETVIANLLLKHKNG